MKPPGSLKGKEVQGFGTSIGMLSQVKWTRIGKRLHRRNMVTKMGSCSTDWSLGGGLPLELLHYIAELLELPDFISFTCVCTAWRSVGLDMTRSRRWLRHQPPLLMLPIADEPQLVASKSRPSRRMRPFSFANSRVFKMKLPVNLCIRPSCPSSRMEFFGFSHGRSFKMQFPAKFCIGASRGWLVLLDKKHPLGSDVQLLNPLTKACVPLPPLGKAKKKMSVVDVYSEYNLAFQKLVLSAEPSDNQIGSSGSCVAMMIDTRYQSRLAFCRPGQTCWTVVEHPSCRKCYDLTYHRGLFFAISLWLGQPQLVVVSLDVCSDANEPMAAAKMVSAPILLPARIHGLNYLVESLGELLLIFRLLSGEPIDIYKTTGFCLFRFDRQQGKWMDLHDIGEQMIFLGKNHSVSLSSRNYPGWKGNCIYFSDDHGHYRGEFRDMGVFDLGDKQIQPFLAGRCWSAPSFWVLQDNDPVI